MRVLALVRAETCSNHIQASCYQLGYLDKDYRGQAREVRLSKARGQIYSTLALLQMSPKLGRMVSAGKSSGLARGVVASV